MCFRPIAAIAACLATSLTGQGPAGQAPAETWTYHDRGMAFSIEFPKRWRQLTPNEALQLRPGMPADLAHLVNPGVNDRFGAVDSWLKEGFDGICLTIEREEGEPDLVEDTLKQFEAALQDHNAKGGIQYETESLAIVPIGEAEIPMVQWCVSAKDAQARPLAGELRFLVPTGGMTLKFTFRSAPEAFDAAQPGFHRMIARLVLNRPAEGRKELSDKLKMPLIIGGVVGLILLMLYALNRR